MGLEKREGEMLPWRWVIKVGPHRKEPGQQKPGEQKRVEQMGVTRCGWEGPREGPESPEPALGIFPSVCGQQWKPQRESPSYHQGELECTSLNWHKGQLRAPFKEEYVRCDFRPGVGAGSRSHCLQLLFLILSYGFLTK